MKNEANKTVLDNRAKFIEMAKNLGITEQKLEQWFNDPKKLSIINALCSKWEFTIYDIISLNDWKHDIHTDACFIYASMYIICNNNKRMYLSTELYFKVWKEMKREKLLNRLYDELEAVAYDKYTHSYNYKRTNQVIRKFFKKVVKKRYVKNTKK